MNQATGTLDPETFESQPQRAVMVTLTSGQKLDISGLSARALQDLQWDQEREYAALIAASSQGSTRRQELFALGYDTVTTIQSQMIDREGRGLVMGFDRRYTELVRALLRRRKQSGTRPRVFEIGYGCGALLSELGNTDIAGIEVSQAMRQQACRRLPAGYHNRLYLGDFLSADLSREAGCDLIFWNDVLEHLVPDEVPAFLLKIRQMLAPGGYLVTITPNWHMRPSDITADYLPPRTTAIGFHLHEYTLREMKVLLQTAGFHVATPLLITKRQIILGGSGLAGFKAALEPALEWIPFRAARLACRALGLSCTVAQAPANV